MTKKIAVGMGKFSVAKNDALLEAIGLGSCVAVCLYSPIKRIGGLAHIMLPYDREKLGTTPSRFANSAIAALLHEMVQLGCNKKNIVAKIFGGASMFSMLQNKIGKENVEAVKKKLKEENIKIVAEDVGGNHGRSIWFDLTTGHVIMSVGHGATREV